MTYRVEVLIDGQWQKMRHVFAERRPAENIARAARGASDVRDARVVESNAESNSTERDGTEPDATV